MTTAITKVSVGLRRKDRSNGRQKFSHKNVKVTTSVPFDHKGLMTATIIRIVRAQWPSWGVVGWSITETHCDLVALATGASNPRCPVCGTADSMDLETADFEGEGVHRSVCRSCAVSVIGKRPIPVAVAFGEEPTS